MVELEEITRRLQEEREREEEIRRTWQNRYGKRLGEALADYALKDPTEPIGEEERNLTGAIVKILEGNDREQKVRAMIGLFEALEFRVWKIAEEGSLPEEY